MEGAGRMASESVRNSIECWIIRRGMGEEDAVLLLHVGEEPDTPGGFWQPITGGIKEGEAPHIYTARTRVGPPDRHGR